MTLNALRSAIKRELDRAAKMPPVERVHEANKIHAMLRFHEEKAMRLRTQAYRELASDFGWSYADLGKEFKHSRARAGQIITE